jgi:hypothetical protein
MSIWIFYHRFARVNSGESRATRGEDPSCRDKVLRRRLILRKGARRGTPACDAFDRETDDEIAR